MFFFSPETKLGSEIMRKILNLLLLKRKRFPPRFVSKRKLLTRSKAKNLKRKKAKKAKKKRKNRFEFCFASFRFEAKITKAKQSEKFEAKISENKRKEAKKEK
jgi:hypothetical protein